MWMGPRGYEQWVPAPKTNADFSSIGVREKDQYLNGGAGVRGSKDGHKEHVLTWSSKRRETLAPVLGIASGDYDEGNGDDLVYFVDPTTYDWNVLPAMLASPYKTALDGIPLAVDSDGYPVYPELVPSPRNTFGYPARSVVYDLDEATFAAPPLYIPIPPGKTFWLGIHGAQQGATLGVVPYNGRAALEPTFPTVLDSDSDQRVNVSWSRADGVTGVEIGLSLMPGSSTGRVTLQGVIGQMLDDGARPFPGGFLAGLGNSGCEFDGIPTVSPYKGGKLWAMSARLVEVGSWR